MIASMIWLTSQDCMRYLSTVLRHRTINVSPATSRPGATMTTHYAQPVTQVSHPVVKHYQPVIPMLTYPITTSSTPRTATSGVRREYSPRTPPSSSRVDATRAQNPDDIHLTYYDSPRTEVWALQTFTPSCGVFLVQCS